MIESQRASNQFYDLTLQWKALQAEMDKLSAKKPDGVVNEFKVRIVNQLLTTANELLPAHWRPINGFLTFEESSAPTNSDVLVVLSQYRRALSEYFDRSTTTKRTGESSMRVWRTKDGAASDISAAKESMF